MDASPVHKVHSTAHRHHRALPDVPASAFSLINNLLNLCPNLETLICWIRTVHNHKQNATRDLLPGDPQRPASKRSRSSKKPFVHSTCMHEKRYKCHKCHTRLGGSKEFIRHMEEKCELLRVYRCPDCDTKPFHRAYHLKKHHKNKHACTQESCTHLANAAEYEPPKSVLGCGYCIKYFDEAKDFLHHLVEHFETSGSEPTWSDTKHVQSLLQQPHLQTIWSSLCTTHSDGSACYWPQLTWNTTDVEEEVHDLQYGISGEDLVSCLESLHQKGRRDIQLDQVKQLATTCVSPPSVSPPSIITTYNSFKDSAFPLVTGLDTQMTNHLPNSYYDPADFINASPSTLVNEDLWAADVSPISQTHRTDGMSFIMSDSKMTPPLFDSTLCYSSERLGLDFWQDKTYDETTYTNTHGPQLPFTVIHPAAAHVDDIEDTVMNTIPGYPSPLGGVTEYHPTPVTGFVTPMDTIFSPPLEDKDMDAMTLGLLPPFNPTPPLQGMRSHKRSKSGRILRMILNMPSIPSTY